LPLVEQVIADGRQAGQPVNARILFSGHPSANRTGKLHAMIAGLNASKNELVAFVDSDMRQDRMALRVLVATLLADDRAGSAFAPVIASEPPSTVGDAVCALMINGLYEPAALATADELGGELPFIMGHLMAFRREAIKAIGGLETAEGQLVDDMFLGRCLNECGYRNRISPHPVAIIHRGTTILGFVQTLVRWIAFSRSGLPTLSFKLRHWLTGMAFWGGLAIALLEASTGHPLLACFAALAPLSVVAMINDLNCRMAGASLPPKYLWVSLLLWLAAPLIYAQILTAREVNWRGRRYQLNMHSRLGQSNSNGNPRR
jgi:ceramide glucosyltransferase